ncbi:MAG: ABC transporter ATP-binding protein [Parcubacteria group bacterium CG10_big_fil_rev_8_21_14_0_10_41_35]|nr:MAG: hypothetical protein COW93_03655 [Parcubacteria group bacterium CG22_combo_CG10-13_8_21_14_all_41_9]PIR57174.1 MAG: ABC transporter ATP-binding protein [Parcubacteria group bacterium CG10_big_fil_rev_8_21_14_0_10_41_35]
MAPKCAFYRYMPTPNNKSVAKIFLQHLWPHKWVGFIVLIGIIIGEGADLVAPIYYKKFFDTLAYNGPITEETVSALISILLMVLLFKGIGWFMLGWTFPVANFIHSKVQVNLERTGFAYLLRHSASFFSNNFTGSLVRKVRRLSRAYEDMVDTIQYQLIPILIAIFGSLAVIAYRNALIAAIIAGLLSFFVVVNYFVAKWKLKYDEQRASLDSEVTGTLADAVTNNTNIKLFTSAEYEQDIFYAITEKFRKMQMKSWNIGEINQTIQFGIMIMIEFIVMFVGIKLWQNGQFTIGDFALLQGYLVMLFGNIRQLGRMIRNTYEALADAKEMVEILEEPHEVSDSKSAKEMKITKGAIEFENMNFSYRKTMHVFKNFNLKIKAREKVALVGPSGSGKTTIVQLILRLHDIQRGKILIDGQSINQVTQESLRKNIALVPQDPILFHRSLMENIRYGKRDATDEEVIEAARKAYCDVLAENLPEKYNTFVGERGIKLSGGERQRIAIARAILANTPILILDEATSSLDSESESYIQQALEELMRDKTTIVIAHRLSTILKMDRIVVMDKGEVVDTGTHQQLAKRAGIYKTLWKIQSQGFIA